MKASYDVEQARDAPPDQMALSSRQQVMENYNLRKNVAHLADVFTRYVGMPRGGSGVPS